MLRWDVGSLVNISDKVKLFTCSRASKCFRLGSWFLSISFFRVVHDLVTPCAAFSLSNDSFTSKYFSIAEFTTVSVEWIHLFGSFTYTVCRHHHPI